MSVEVWSRRRWVPLPADTAPEVDETNVLRLRGLVPEELVHVGPLTVTASTVGTAEVRLTDHDSLACHLGLLPIHTVGADAEVDVVPGKVSVAQYRRLRADLESVWVGLVLNPAGPTALAARGPDARVLWRQLHPIIEEIRGSPRSELAIVPLTMRLERVRRLTALRPALVLAAARGSAASVPTLVERPVGADHAVVADTVARLAALARRQDASDVESACEMLLRDPLFARHRPVMSLSHGTRFDPRYRQVARLRHGLLAPAGTVTEGPGELRLGVRGIHRLYEYWVFLQILMWVIGKLGPPDPPELAQLAVRAPGSRLRLDLRPGTTVHFGNGVEVAFTPTISSNSDQSWRRLEHAPHPDKAHFRTFITPDVGVFLPGKPPTVIVIDAKYRARYRIDAAGVETHARYGRVRLDGLRAVSEVLVAHPHRGLHLAFAGYRAVPMVPGEPVDLGLPLPATPRTRPKAVGLLAPLGSQPGPVTVLADQWWLRQQIQGGRIDLRDLQRFALAGRELAAAVMAMPSLGALTSFAHAVMRVGWHIAAVPLRREEQVSTLVTLAQGGIGSLVVVSGDPEVHRALDEAGLTREEIDDLSSVPRVTM